MQVKDLQLKKALRTALLVLLLNVARMTNVYAVTIGDLTYSLNNSTLTAAVTGHKNGTNATGSLTIPSSVTYTSNEYVNGEYVSVTRTYTVTEIGYMAFYHCSGLVGDLTIPNSVTTIKAHAFDCCTGFTGSLTIGNSVTTINDVAFNGCSGFAEVHYNAINCNDYTGFGGEEVMPFGNCGGIFLIGENVHRIPGAMFGYGNFTGNLSIPNSVISIGDVAFRDCSSFTGSLNIGNSVTSIGYGAFANCSGFTGNLTIPNSVTTIGDYAFYDCSGFTGSLTIPNSVTTIGNYAFYGCNSFFGSLTIGNSVMTIGDHAFHGCSGFSGNLTIGNSVTNIGVNAFYLCSGFTGNLTIPNSVSKIGLGAFLDCSGFDGVLTIPNSVDTIDISAFKNCSSFTTVHYNATNCVVISSDRPPFLGCGGHLIIGDDVERIPDNMFYQSGFNSLTIGNSVTKIGKCAFSYSSGITGSLILPESMIEIDSAAFLDCSGFSGDLTIGEAVTKIGPRAFANCTGFNSIHYNATDCESVGYSEATNNWTFAFYGNSSLQEIVIGDNVTQIPDYAFGNHGAQNCQLTLGNAIETIGYGAFYNNGTNWQGLIGTLEIPNSVTKIEGRAFYGCRGLTGKLEIPNTVTKIGDNAFLQCSGFTGNLVIPNSVDTIGFGAFIYCSGFSDTLVIGTGIRSMDISAFRRCSGITEIQYNATNCLMAGDGEKPIFNELSNLNKIVIGENVEFLPDYLFANCYSTQFIRSYAEVPPAIGGANAFFGIDREVLVGVPCGTMEDYEEADYWSEFNNYTDAEYLLAVKANPEYLGRAVIVQQPNCNSSRCVVRAIPERGCRFINWTCNGEEVTQIINYAFDLDEDKVMVANFETMRHFSGGGGTFVWSDPSNWEPEGVPTDTMAVDIQANVIVDTDANVGSVFNHSDKVLTVMPNVVLTVNQTLESPNASGIIIEDGGQIVHHNEGAKATVKKTVDAYDEANDNWNLISFPLADTGYMASVINLLSNEYDLYYYDEPTAYWINQEYTENGFDQLKAGKGYLYANSGIQNCVFDQAIYVTDRGLIDGHDASVLQSSQTTNGYNVIYNTAMLADDFKINAATTIHAIEVYAYQSNSDTVSTMTGFYVQIYDGNPMDGGQPIWGDANTNIITSTNWTNCYRTDSSINMNRPVMSVTADNLNIELDAGTYYLVWSLTGSMSSGPWGIPVTILNIENTGNGLQYLQGSWKYALDSGTEQGIGFAFRLFGTSGQASTNNTFLSFIGELESGSTTITVPLSYTETAGNLKGFNLVGNPYVHNITTYGSTNVAEGCFRLNDTKDNLIVSEVSETLPLKPAEGFFVKATAEGASITFNSGRSRGETERKGFVNLELRDNGKLIDRLIVKKDGDPLEKLTLKENGTRLYAIQNKQEIAIVSCEGDEQPVNFKAAKNGSYMITTSLDNMAVDYLHLIDNLTGADVDLLVEPSYSFDACTMDYASRFRLVFSVCGDADGDDAPFAFINNGNIIIIGAEAGAVLQIVDVLGHVLVSRKGDAINRISTNGMASGVYILRLIQGEDVKTQKIVIE